MLTIQPKTFDGYVPNKRSWLKKGILMLTKQPSRGGQIVLDDHCLHGGMNSFPEQRALRTIARNAPLQGYSQCTTFVVVLSRPDCTRRFES
jgi:hypothetical protein